MLSLWFNSIFLRIRSFSQNSGIEIQFKICVELSASLVLIPRHNGTTWMNHTVDWFLITQSSHFIATNKWIDQNIHFSCTVYANLIFHSIPTPLVHKRAILFPQSDPIPRGIDPFPISALILGRKASQDFWLRNTIEEYEANTTATRMAMTITPFHTPPVSSLHGVANCASNAA